MGDEKVISETEPNSAENSGNKNQVDIISVLKIANGPEKLSLSQDGENSCSAVNSENNQNGVNSEKHSSETETNSADNTSKKNKIDNGPEKEVRSQEEENSCSAVNSENNQNGANSEKSKETEKISNHELNSETVGTTQDTDKKEQEFRVAPTNNLFKLRIVPIEKLLEKPPQPKTQHNREKRETREKKPLRCLPERKNRKKYSFIEASDSEETSDTTTNSSTTKSSEPARSKRERKNKISLKSIPSDSDSEAPTHSRDTKKTNKPSKETVATNKQSAKAKKPTSNNVKIITLDPPVTVENALKQKLIKRCKVRIKRTSLSTFSKQLAEAASKKTHKMNGNNSVEVLEKDNGATTSTFNTLKLHQLSSDSDDDDDLQMQEIANRATKIANNFSSAQNSDESDARSSGSEIMPARKKRVFNKRKKSSSANDSDFEPIDDKTKQQKTKRRRVKKNSSSGSDRSGGKSDDDDEDNKNKRKHIRKIIKTKDLETTTITATKEEENRRKRIEERQKLYNTIYEKPDSVEVNELVLDFDEETKEPLLEVDKGLLKRLKPHQVAGVKFMWDACFETLKDSLEKPGSGCILAHCMGLGKTLQIVALSHTLMINSRRTKVERTMIISPLSTLTNWAREFKHWMGFARKKHIEIYDLSRFKDKPTRIFKLNEWFEEGGVCILGYDMYRILANEKAKGLRKKQRDILQKALVDPGPDLVVCDEGHLLKNEKTSISKAVTRIRSKRRIVLTGTPLQNNLKEYYCMIQFIKPNLLGTYKEYLNRFVNPITNGQYTDSTERDIRLMKHRSHILHKMLEGCIQRRDYSVLAPYLPPKHEYVVYTTLSELQQQLYAFYMETQRDITGFEVSGKGARLFQDFQDLRRIWTHPMNLRVNSDTVIRKRLLANETDSMEDFIDDDGDDDEDESKYYSSNNSVDSSKSFASGGGSARVNKGGSKPRKMRSNNVDNNDSDIEELLPIQNDDPSEWWKRFVEDKELNNINHSPKLVILMRLLEQCEEIGDKLLVFSQSLQSLDVIEHFLKLINNKTRGHEYEGDIGDFKGHWNVGLDYFRLDGSCSVEQREVMCKKFNNVTNLRARLFLISTRAGGLGINLVAANRVVIFDVSWNPSHDTQSIFRVYRFGQEKPCYIYRLIAMGTMEQKVYERQVAKQATAKRVIDEQQISRHYNQSDLQELYTYELKPTTEREIPILPKDRLFAEMLTELSTLLFKYHEHDSLLENEESENLSEEDRKAAWTEYEAEKTRTVQTAQYIAYDRSAYGTQFGNSAGSVTSNKIFGFRSDVLLQLLNMKIAQDHPEFNQNQILQLVPSYLQRLYTEMNNGDPTIYKDLLSLHATLAHPSGMYMSPLLYANQETNAAGYFQSQQATVAGDGKTLAPLPSRPAPGFNPDEVYEID